MKKVIAVPTLKLNVPLDMKALRELAGHRRRLMQRTRHTQASKDLTRMHCKTETVGMFEMDIIQTKES